MTTRIAASSPSASPSPTMSAPPSLALSHRSCAARSPARENSLVKLLSSSLAHSPKPRSNKWSSACRISHPAPAASPSACRLSPPDRSQPCSRNPLSQQSLYPRPQAPWSWPSSIIHHPSSLPAEYARHRLQPVRPFRHRRAPAGHQSMARRHHLVPRPLPPARPRGVPPHRRN